MVPSFAIRSQGVVTDCPRNLSFTGIDPYEFLFFSGHPVYVYFLINVCLLFYTNITIVYLYALCIMLLLSSPCVYTFHAIYLYALYIMLLLSSPCVYTVHGIYLYALCIMLLLLSPCVYTVHGIYLYALHIMFLLLLLSITATLAFRPTRVRNQLVNSEVYRAIDKCVFDRVLVVNASVDGMESISSTEYTFKDNLATLNITVESPKSPIQGLPRVYDVT